MSGRESSAFVNKGHKMGMVPLCGGVQSEEFLPCLFLAALSKVLNPSAALIASYLTLVIGMGCHEVKVLWKDGLGIGHGGGGKYTNQSVQLLNCWKWW